MLQNEEMLVALAAAVHAMSTTAAITATMSANSTNLHLKCG